MRKTFLLLLLFASVSLLKAQTFTMPKDINTVPSAVGSEPNNFISVNGEVFFVSTTPLYGQELWKTNGTAAGTVMVKDIWAGSTGSNIANPQTQVVVGSTLYFMANDGINGHELWKSDGTADGTVMVQDIAPGSGSSSPLAIVYLDGKLFLSAQREETGRELFVANTFVTLPLTLLDFSARLRNADGLVSWKTAGEEKIDAFEVERSLNGRVFTKVGSVAAGGAAYSFTDPNITSLGAAVVYYRLRITESNGTFTYSIVVPVLIPRKEVLARLYPNPAQAAATLVIDAPKTESIRYIIVDAGGRTVAAKSLVVTEGLNQLPVELKSLSSGTYTLLVKGEKTSSELRFVKQ